MSFLHEAAIYLGAAVLAVPLFNRLKLGSVLGYLVAGVVIGPAGLGLINDVESVLHFAEFGVVLLLFLIGLELQPSRLWGMRRKVFGTGGAQLALTAPILAGLGMAVCGWPPTLAILVGLGLSLSSTALALQLLSEKNQLTSAYGQVTFGVLLFQDLAVIPLLALLPFLGTTGSAASGPWWLGALRIGGVMAMVVAGKYILRPVLRLIAAQHSHELFTATALLVVVGTALGVSAVGLSMALGAFLAGVLLADSEYRHELEADLEPFKGLLLGLFFIAVGMSVNMAQVLARPLWMAAAVVTLVGVKALVLWCLGYFSLKSRAGAWGMAAILSQGGEFAFVLFRLAVGFGAMDQQTADLLVAVVTLSMATTPILFTLLEAGLKKPGQKHTPAFDVSPDADTPVIIAGFGRVGQVVARVLRAKRITFTALDVDAEHIDFVKKFGSKVFYGDASRLDLLRAARADKAQVFVLAIDDPDASVRTARTVLENFPHLKIIARARNRPHAYRLLSMGLVHVIRETWAGSLDMTALLLNELGLAYSDSTTAIERFREHDEALVQSTYRYLDDPDKLQELASKARRELESLFDRDARD